MHRPTILNLILVIVFSLSAEGRISSSPASPSFSPSRGRRYESPFSVEELLSLVLRPRVSRDIDMDPCKRIIVGGDIVGGIKGNNATKKGMDEFDVRDTVSEPRVGRGSGSDLDLSLNFYWI